MESRKIQVTGGSSFIVTLPKDWVEGSGLRKNDTVYLEPGEDGSLVISAQEGSGHARGTDRTIALDGTEGPELVTRELIGAYIAGHTVITITGPMGPGIMDAVMEFSRTAVGMEIIDEKKDSVSVKNLMDPAEIRPGVAVERMRILVENLLSDAVDAMIDGSGLDSMEKRDRDVDRVDWFMARQTSIMRMHPDLYAHLEVTPADMSEYLHVSRLIESISDHIVTMNTCVSFMDDPIEMQSIGTVMKDLRLPELFSECMDAFKNRDINAANACISKCEETAKKIMEILELASIMDHSTATATALISGNIKRILRYFEDISEATIDSAMRL